MAAGRLFDRGSWAEASRIAEILRNETVGGLLLLAAAAAAIVWANVAPGSYDGLSAFVVGPAALHLDLSLEQWAADGLLALFFFVAGLELKREFVAGDLRDPRRAAVPIAAAVGGMIVPALIYTAINLNGAEGALTGWAIPTATDIAFALAVLAIISTHLPSALRIFLLTLAVVDDLLAITVIALFYTDHVNVAALGLMLVPLAAFGVLVQRGIRVWYLLVPLAVLTWALMHASGIHATVAGVLLAFTVPVRRRDGAAGPGMAEQFEHRLRPLSAGFAVPVFAFFAAGVTIGGLGWFADALGDRITLGVIAGLIVGKTVGILLATFVTGRLTGSSLADELSWWDVTGLAMLGGVGFTVSLLIGELAFGSGTADDYVKVGVLLGSVGAALLAAVLLRTRNRVYRRMVEEESVDADHDGVPDVYERDEEGTSS